MAQITYEEVVKLADQLTLHEQQALITHLQELAQKRELSFPEWEMLFDALKSDVPIIGEFSDRRVDWYDDDGR